LLATNGRGLKQAGLICQNYNLKTNFPNTKPTLFSPFAPLAANPCCGPSFISLLFSVFVV